KKRERIKVIEVHGHGNKGLEYVIASATVIPRRKHHTTCLQTQKPLPTAK
ncbi:hypothetical protein HN51_037163, partial [Arachis hypogaea]